MEEIAKPIITQIVVRNLRSGEGSRASRLSTEDVTSDAVVRILQRLRAFKADPERYVISNFAGLVATTSYRSVADSLRGRHLQRSNFEKKIRRLFAANKDLLIWKDGQNDPLCGFVSWRAEESGSSTVGNEYTPQSELTSLTEELPALAQKRNTAEVVLLVLTRIGRPIRLHDLIDLAGHLVEAQPISFDETLSDHSTQSVSQLDPLTAIETRLLLERLFREIQKLGVQQRKSLLLNMTDSYGYSIEWFLFTKIATERELSNLLQIPVDQFKLLLGDLPMTDKEIAEHLEISPTRVANMRRAVRDRLERCRQAFLHGELELRRKREGI